LFRVDILIARSGAQALNVEARFHCIAVVRIRTRDRITTDQTPRSSHAGAPGFGMKPAAQES